MEQLNFGDIVLLKFPFTDTKGAKKRPALVIKDFEDGDIIVCRITSQLYETQFDFLLKNWKECGLILPSVIRVHKIATLEKNIVEMKMGEINSKSKKAISTIIKKLMV